ncbi:MAG: DNA alkylation repair protein [Rubrivivax sp.]
MAEPFKLLLSPTLIGRMALHLKRVDRRFDAARFVALAGCGLDALEMKARALQIADALEATLPVGFGRAAAQIEAALAPPWPDDRLGSDDPARDGLEGWALWPVGEFVARRGIDEPDRALRTLHALTQRFSAEYAIRPFIVAHPALVFGTLQRWTSDPSAHVRRLVSEGSRPRLPWGLRLQALVRDPTPTLPLLAALQDDPSEYVRRSVANHLNDISKDHPALVVDWVRRELPVADAARRALLQHASRTLVRQGHRPMLAAWGLGGRWRGDIRWSVAPARLLLGQSLTLSLSLRSSARQTQRLVVDYAVHHVKADGASSPKVFKGWSLELGPGAARELVRRLPVRPVTTRRHHAGRHVVDVRINGRVVAEAAFDLIMP